MIKNITVIGGGTMGHGIAECFAIHGYKVKLQEINKEIRENVKLNILKELKILAEEDIIKEEQIAEILENISLHEDLEEAVKNSDYVIEAIVENLEIKQELFKNLDKFCPEHAILTSNTSSLKISDINKYLTDDRKTKTMVTHWYNPGHIMPIAELTYFGDTSKDTFNKVKKLYESIEKVVVKVDKDVPGLIANRIQQGVAREVFSLIQMGVASPEDIDKALKFGPAFRYCSTGQLEIADFGGLDIWAIVGDNLLAVMDNSRGANSILKEKVKEGKLGLKTGEGFYDYDDEKKEEIKKNYTKKLITQLKVSKKYI
ncbi:MAG: 3-hydroxyacyl-CoA dehydrogenase family protein [Bacillota bacterium]|nr:3-hydroxyacyl-CoA dehydrogenase family protein [Bacillota bacterium]